MIKGWIRLWIVLTLVGVPAAAMMQQRQSASIWAMLDKIAIEKCVDAEHDLPTHPDALECGRKLGTFQTFFEREHTTPAKYWSESLGAFFLADLVITAIAVVAALAIRWVFRGFRPARTKASV